MEKYHLSIEKLIENCTLGPKDNLFKVLHCCPRFLYDISTGIIKSVSHMILMALIFEFIAPMCYFVMFDVCCVFGGFYVFCMFLHCFYWFRLFLKGYIYYIDNRVVYSRPESVGTLHFRNTFFMYKMMNLQ